MSMQNFLNQFMGSSNAGAGTGGVGNSLNKLTGSLPGGLMGGAAAGGIMALLVSNKKARKFAGTAASVGGAALLGGLAYRAYKNWQQNDQNPASAHSAPQAEAVQPAGIPAEALPAEFELQLIKAMIAAARADGHIDATEQQRIFKAVEQMDLSAEMKGRVFDLLNQPISVQQLAQGIEDMTQKSELYLASCLVIDPDHPAEQAHLDQLAQALALPQGLAEQLRWQARQAIQEAA